MVDTALYTDTAGAKGSLEKMRLIANNLANLNTAGFYADYETLVARPTEDDPAKQDQGRLQTRIMPNNTRTYTDFRPGPIHFTGRDLDIAIDGPGFFAVQSKSGQEAYTRAGNFDITPQGLLVTHKGELVLGEGGVISVPPAARVSIDNDGNVYATSADEANTNRALVGKIKLVDIPIQSLYKGDEGLFHLLPDRTATPAKQVELVPESIEGSNVDAVRALTELIDISRKFDMHTNHISKMDDNAAKANQLLDIPRL